MSDQWHDDSISTAQVKDDDVDAPDDWEAALEENVCTATLFFLFWIFIFQPKTADVEEKPKASGKAPTTTKNKASKKKYTDEDDSEKIIEQSDANYTPEQLDQIQKKGELKQEHDKLDMVSELVDKNGERQSLDNLNLITREEFLNYSLRLHNHLDIVSKSEFYPEFIEHFLTGITKSMSTDGVKRLSSTLQVITLRKQSEEREKKSKSKSKNKAKPQLKPVRQTDYGAFGVDVDDQDVDYDDDDFM